MSFFPHTTSVCESHLISYGCSAPGLYYSLIHTNFPLVVSRNKFLPATSCYTFPLPLKPRVSGRRVGNPLWKEEIRHPTRETDSTKYHRGRQHNYAYHSPWPEAMTRGNKLLQRGWHHVRYKQLPQKVHVKQCFIYGLSQHFKHTLPTSETTANHIQMKLTLLRCVLYMANFFFV